KIAKQRSLHNNYLTLPVIFFMLSSHYPLAFATQWNWLIAALIFLVGVVIRHYFNTRHARKGNPHWTWAVAVALFLIIAWLSTAPKLPTGAETVLSPSAAAFKASPHFVAVSQIVDTRCVMCHTAEPVWDGVHQPPKNVILDTPIAVANHAHEIAIQSGWSHAMPPGNVSEMTDAERALIVAWFREGSAR
ncbi:MAG: urate hydroxylase PuuD, partial [Devosia sp.]